MLDGGTDPPSCPPRLGLPSLSTAVPDRRADKSRTPELEGPEEVDGHTRVPLGTSATRSGSRGSRPARPLATRTETPRRHRTAPGFRYERHTSHVCPSARPPDL